MWGISKHQLLEVEQHALDNGGVMIFVVCY